MEDEIQIIEKEKPKKGATVIFAFPDVGLVGPIASKYIVKGLEMKEIGYITSEKLPPITAVHKSRPTYLIRIFEKDNLVVVLSEIPVAPDLINAFSNSLSKWLKDIKAGKAILLGGLPDRNRMEVEEPKVHGVPSNEDMHKLLEENGLHVIQEGFIAGINGVLLRDLTRNGFSGIYLMGESYPNYPDPGSAASVLEALNNLEGLNVDVEELREKEEEIKVAARDLMRKTQKAMEESAKDQEEEIPLMYM